MVLLNLTSLSVKSFSEDARCNINCRMLLNQFHPEILRANLKLERKWAFIVISPSKVTMARYNERTLEVLCLEMDIESSQFKSELPRIKNMASDMFLNDMDSQLSPGHLNLVGLVIALSESFYKTIPTLPPDQVQFQWHDMLAKVSAYLLL
jgi:hypothetical protein